MEQGSVEETVCKSRQGIQDSTAPKPFIHPSEENETLSPKADILQPSVTSENNAGGLDCVSFPLDSQLKIFHTGFTSKLDPDL